VYWNTRDVEGTFEKLAIIRTKGDASLASSEVMLQQARAEAAKLGANGILLESIPREAEGAQLTAALLGVPTSRRGEIVAIHVHPVVGPPLDRAPALQPVSMIEPEPEADPGAGPTFGEWLAAKKAKAAAEAEQE
jgi:hypothetical protein